MSSEIYDAFRASREQDKIDGTERRHLAAGDAATAGAMALEAGMRLIKKDVYLYQLHGPENADGKRWLLNLYPGNRRVYAPKREPKAPFLGLAGVEWTLGDVVVAAIEKEL